MLSFLPFDISSVPHAAAPDKPQIGKDPYLPQYGIAQADCL
jgi:hypothetical protein